MSIDARLKAVYSTLPKLTPRFDGPSPEQLAKLPARDRHRWRGLKGAYNHKVREAQLKERIPVAWRAGADARTKGKPATDLPLDEHLRPAWRCGWLGIPLHPSTKPRGEPPREGPSKRFRVALADGTETQLLYTPALHPREPWSLVGFRRFRDRAEMVECCQYAITEIAELSTNT